MFDIKKAKEEAQKEISEEQMKDAKNKYKKKLREISAARKIVANLERELEDLEIELSQ
jgi:hypothetical protein